MFKNNSRHIPVGVLMIAAFYLFGAVVLLVSRFTNPVEVSRTIGNTHGLSPTTDTVILPIVAALALLMAFGLVTLSRWGFFLTVIYLFYFGLINVRLMIHSFQQPYMGNVTWSLLVLAYLTVKHRVFLESAGSVM